MTNSVVIGVRTANLCKYEDQRDIRIDHGFIILNPYGGIWHSDIFATPEAATAYLRESWGSLPGGFSIVAGYKTISVAYDVEAPSFKLEF